MNAEQQVDIRIIAKCQMSDRHSYLITQLLAERERLLSALKNLTGNFECYCRDVPISDRPCFYCAARAAITFAET